jgi:hypothetical protein
MIDRSISIVEVANIDGSRAFVEKKDRQATQTLIRTLSEGMSATESDSISPADIIGKVLNLTAKDAVELGLVDGTAESAADILAEIQLSEAKMTPVPGVEKVIKKFTAARRNISENLLRIEGYERDIETLSDQFSTIDNQLRTATQTRETNRVDPWYPGFSSREKSFSSDYDEYGQDRDGMARTGRRRKMPGSQKVTTEEPRVDVEIVYAQLTTALRDVVDEYRRVLNLVDRWPSGLPQKVTKTMLQENMDSASSDLDRLYRYQPVYPSQNQPEIRQYPRRSRDSRRY